MEEKVTGATDTIVVCCLLLQWKEMLDFMLSLHKNKDAVFS